MRYGATSAIDAEASRGRRTVLTVLGVLAVGLAVAVGVFGYRYWKAEEEERQRAAAVQAARQTAVNLASLDYRDVQKGVDRVLAGMTGEVRNQWATQAKTIVDTATKAQTMSQVQQVRAGVVSMDGDSAEVIVAITATVTNPKVPQGSPRYYRFSMDMTRTDGRWLVSNLGLVP
ncbi:hypothetical protein Arub01_42230 [Actinomadura rubrobrunea]|uniref:Mce-associated membrane protein n=1 Tax=Actinomadura rubrobrunea TaxID=115335 RepID=A0A9W6PZQ3_9ACTN|nr:hypothetical protein [Actinomadura rubrobrunea]GLW65979.1 hypothetical protein Arub01_42230 [Actinomadura rubrobrunea]